VTILLAAQLSRKVRMKDPDKEQEAIDGYVRSDVLVLDDLGAGPDTPFSRQILQEILDGRDFADRPGLVVTTKYSLNELAGKRVDDSIPSRLAGCSIDLTGHPGATSGLPSRTPWLVRGCKRTRRHSV